MFSMKRKEAIYDTKLSLLRVAPVHRKKRKYSARRYGSSIANAQIDNLMK